MKLVRFKKDEDLLYGILHGDEVLELQQEKGRGSRPEIFRMDEIEILPPCTPSKIIAIGLNYRDHAEEMKKPLPEEPLIFLKPGSAVIGHNELVIYPEMSRRIDYEAELALIVGKRAHRVSSDDARKYILGYTCFNDVTARDIQKKDVQYTRAKGFDTFAPIGPWIETELDPGGLNIESYLNGEKRQSSNTDRMIFDVFYLFSFISHIMTLLPGDVIATGTPSGVGPMKAGDEIEIRIDGIGKLVNKVVRSQ